MIMKLLENIAIDTRALEYMLTNIGLKRPEIPAQSYQLDMMDNWSKSGYRVESLYWESFGGRDFPFKVNIPFNGKWWFSKLPPGSVFPYHIDIYQEVEPKRRLWIAYTDYQPGHIFSYGDKILTGYKAGDVYEFDDTQVCHGAANCGLTTKISLQIVI